MVDTGLMVYVLKHLVLLEAGFFLINLTLINKPYNCLCLYFFL